MPIVFSCLGHVSRAHHPEAGMSWFPLDQLLMATQEVGTVGEAGIHTLCL